MTQASSTARVPPWMAYSLVAMGAAANTAAAIAVVAWILPRGDVVVWQWPLRTTPVAPLPWTLPCSVCLLLAVLAGLDTLREGKTPSRLVCAVLIAALTLCSGLFMLSLALDDRDFPLRAPAVILGDVSMGYYVQATRVKDPVHYLQEVRDRTEVGRVPERVATHPPGPVLYFWAARQLLSARPDAVTTLKRVLEHWAQDPGLVGVEMLCRRVCTIGPSAQDVVLAFWAGLGLTLLTPLAVPLLFTLGTLAQGRRAGLVACILGTAVPSLVCFMPSVDGASAVCAAAVLALWMWGLRTRSLLPAIVAGGLWFVGLFWTSGLLALGLPMAVVAWLSGRDRDGQRRALRSAAGCIAAMVALGLVGYLTLGYDPVSSTVRSLRAQSQIMHLTGRPYGPAVLWNLYEFALFVGPGLLALGLVGTMARTRTADGRRPDAGLGVGVLVTVLVLALSGSTRGEVGRIWGFLMPPLAIPAALPLLSLRGWALMSAGLLVVASQVALTVAIHSQWNLVAP